MRMLLFALSLALAGAFHAPSHAGTRLRSSTTPVLSEREVETTAEVDVSPAADAIRKDLAELDERPPSEYDEYRARVGKGVNADKRNPDGSIPLQVKFDVRWFIFLALFSIGEDAILEVTAPLRELSIAGTQPFNTVISVLAGPVVRSADGQGLHEVPTGGLAICLLYFAYWKGWTADAARAVKSQLRSLRDRDSR